MAVTTIEPPVAGELTDEQIETLLARATARLKAKKHSSQDVLKLDNGQTYTFPKLQPGKLEKAYISQQDGVATVDGTRVVDHKEREQANIVRKAVNPMEAKKLAAEKKKETAGAAWFDLPRTNLTPELKRDLQLIKVRNVLDPHRHYKKDGGGKMKPPEFSQVGTIIEGPTEFFTGRIENKKRKRTFVEEVLAGEQETGRFKRKYGEYQSKTTNGKKAFYKALKEKRKMGGVRKSGRG